MLTVWVRILKRHRLGRRLLEVASDYNLYYTQSAFAPGPFPTGNFPISSVNAPPVQPAPVPSELSQVLRSMSELIALNSALIR